MREAIRPQKAQDHFHCSQWQSPPWVSFCGSRSRLTISCFPTNVQWHGNILYCLVVSILASLLLPNLFRSLSILSLILSERGFLLGLVLSVCHTSLIQSVSREKKKILLTEVAGAMPVLCSPRQQKQAGWGKYTSSHLGNGPLSIKQITASYLNDTVPCKIHKSRIPKECL